MKTFKIKEDVFKTETLFIVNCCYKHVNSYLKKRFNWERELGELTVGSVINCDNRFFRIVWLESFDKKHIEELVHELFHLTTIICQNKQVPIIANISTGECGDETAAYLLEFYIKKCLKKL